MANGSRIMGERKFGLKIRCEANKLVLSINDYSTLVYTAAAATDEIDICSISVSEFQYTSTRSY